MRAALGVRTVFNILGPLTNPAAPPFLVIGAFDRPTAELMAQALAGSGIERAFVIHGAEAGTSRRRSGRSWLFDVRGRRGEARAARTRPTMACRAARRRRWPAATPRTMRARCNGVLAGEEHGAHRDALLLGAALALEVSGAEAAPRRRIARARRGDRYRRGAARCSALAAIASRLGGARMSRSPAGDFLAAMARASAARVVRWHARDCGDAEIRRAPRQLRRRRACGCRRGGFDLIAEVKLRSPAAGQLARASEDRSGARRRPMPRGRGGGLGADRAERFDGRLAHLPGRRRARAARRAGDAQGLPGRPVSGL